MSLRRLTTSSASPMAPALGSSGSTPSRESEPTSRKFSAGASLDGSSRTSCDLRGPARPSSERVLGRHQRPRRCRRRRRARRARARARREGGAVGSWAWPTRLPAGCRPNPGTRPGVRSRRTQVDDVAGGEAVGDGAGVDHDEPAVGLDVGRRALEHAVGTLDAHPPPERAERARGSAAAMSAGSAVVGARAAAPSTSSGSMPSPRRAAPSGAQPTLRPSPTTTGPVRRGARRGSRRACARRPAGRWATSARRRRRRPRGTRRRRRGRRAASARPGAAGTSRNRIDTSRLAPGGASQRRSSRPLPAVWWSAHEHAAVGPVGGRRQQVGVRAAGLVDVLDRPTRGRPRGRWPRLAASWWRPIVHATYIGSRAAEDPDRQPGRDRRPRHPGRPRARHRDGRGLLRARSRRAPRPPRRRGLRARRADGGRELPQHRGDPRRHPPAAAPTACTPATASSARTPTSPGRSPRWAWRSSARRRGDRGDGRQGVEPQGGAARRRADRARHHRVRPVGRRDPGVRRGATAGRSRSRRRSAAAAGA